MKRELEKSRLLSMTQIAMLTAMMAILSQISLPMPSNVPLTLQTFAVALCAFFGGMRRGVPAFLLYLALGAVGVPVFSGFRGGFGVLLGLTGGFLWGFLPLVLCCALAAATQKRAARIGFAAVGLLLCHACGILQYACIAGTSPVQSLLLVSAPYLLKDVLSLYIGCRAASAVRCALASAGIEQ